MSVQAPDSLPTLLQQLQQELQNQRQEIVSLRSDLSAAQSQILQLSQHLLERSAQQPPPPFFRSRLPDPPRFDGKPLTFRVWLPSIRAKIRSDQLAGADAFDYVWDRLEAPQQASVLHLRHSAEDAQSWDYEAIFSFFQRLCHNPREHQEAVQRLASVRQRDDESLIAYLARFERLIHEAKANSWPDVSRVSALHRGLRQSLRQRLEESHDSLFELTYQEYVEVVQSSDRRFRRQLPPKSSSSGPSADAMEVDPIQSRVAHRPPSPFSVPSSEQEGRPQSTPAYGERKLTHSERNLCFRCGSPDHWVAECPLTQESEA